MWRARSDGLRQATRLIRTKVADPSLKCDEAWLVCHRCVESQRICYGMRAGQACCPYGCLEWSQHEDAVHRPRNLNPKTPFVATLQNFSHHNRALTILKNWKDHLSHRQPATDVVKYIRRSMIKSALLRNLASPEWILEGTSSSEHFFYEWPMSVIGCLSFSRRRLANNTRLMNSLQ